MKKLNDTQKKWALTACLATVLSFNLVMGLAGSEYSTANFASKDEDSEVKESSSDSTEPRFESIITEEGRLKIKYLQDEEGSTIAIVPKKLESGFCWDKCGKKYLLPKNFDSSKADLEQALRKAMVKETVKKAIDNKEKGSSAEEDLDVVVAQKSKKLTKKIEEDSDETEEAPEDKDLRALEKKCDPKEDDARMECFANGLTRLLKDKKKEHAKEDVMALYKKEIEPSLLESLTDVRNSDRREEGQAILEDMLSSIAKKHNYLRERMVKLSALVVIKAEQEAQKRFQQAETVKTTNPMQALKLQTEGFNRRSMAEHLAMNLDYTLQSGLETAQLSNLITESKMVDLYTTQYADVVNPIIQGMRQNPHTFVIQTSTLSDGSGLSIIDGSGGTLVPVNPSQGAIGQLRSAGRGITIISNGLTASNSINSATPRIITLNGIQAGAGTATIQVITPAQIPSTVNKPALTPGTNVLGNRSR